MNISTVLRQFQKAPLLASRVSLETCCTSRTSVNRVPVLLEVSKRWKWKEHDRRFLIKTTPLKDMGTQGETQLNVDLVNIHESKEKESQKLFPDADTPNTLFDGIKFCDLPICHIKATKNNTQMHFTDKDGNHICFRTCGLEGFKNTKKGTNIAAQTTAITIGGMAKQKGVNTVRVMVQGLGPGRMSAVKGLQMAGLKIVSVTDNTPISFYPPRPRKARRL